MGAGSLAPIFLGEGNMPTWVITADQGFEGNAAEAMEILDQNARTARQPMKLWKLHSEAAVEVDVTITTEDD
jgi:hypothetical protein